MENSALVQDTQKLRVFLGLSAQSTMPSLPGPLLHLSGQLSPLLLLGSQFSRAFPKAHQ